jgi:hypothetical protein
VEAAKETACQLWVSIFANSMAESFQTLRQYRLGKEMIMVAVGAKFDTVAIYLWHPVKPSRWVAKMGPDANSESKECMMAQPMTRRRDVDFLPCSRHACVEWEFNLLCHEQDVYC